MAQQSGLKLHTVDDQFSCFEFSGKWGSNCNFSLVASIPWEFILFAYVTTFAAK